MTVVSALNSQEQMHFCEASLTSPVSPQKALGQPEVHNVTLSQKQTTKSRNMAVFLQQIYIKSNMFEQVNYDFPSKFTL